MSREITDSIVVGTFFKQETFQQVEVERTEKEIYKSLFLSPLNKLQSDGRINGGYNKEGLLLAHSISPQFEQFEGQVEKGVYPIVSALIDKGYMTICSCEGHPGRLNVKLGFGTENCRLVFMEYLERLNIPFLRLIPHEHCINMQANFNSKKENHAESIFDRYHVECETEALYIENAKAFNFQFQTDFLKWYFLDINMFEYESWRPIYNFRIKKALKNKWDYVSLLTNAVKSDDLPTYRETFKKSRRLMRKEGKKWNADVIKTSNI